MTQRTATGAVGEWAPLAEPLGEPLVEAALLGCLLQTTAAHARQVLARLAEQDWSVPQHAHVAQAIRALLEDGVPVDPVTVLGQLRRQGLENAQTANRDAGVLLIELCRQQMSSSEPARNSQRPATSPARSSPPHRCHRICPRPSVAQRKPSRQTCAAESSSTTVSRSL